MRLLFMLSSVTVALAVAAAACGAQTDPEGSAVGREILDELRRMAEEMETGARPVMDRPPVRPEDGETYPPARFIGPCSIWQAPEEIRPGDRWTVKNIVTDFFRVEEDGSWNGVGVLPGLTPRRPGERRECQPDEDYIVLGAITETVHGPGDYVSLTRGYEERLEARSCPSPSGPTCYSEETLDRREVADTVRFTVVPRH